MASDTQTSQSPHHSDEGNNNTDTLEPRRQTLRNPACDYCREKKIRCDRVKPTCSHCRTSRIDCTYSDPQKRPSDTVRSTNKFEELNARLERIENSIAALTTAFQESRKDSSVSTCDRDKCDIKTSPSPIPGPADIQVNRGIESINNPPDPEHDSYPPSIPGCSLPRTPSHIPSKKPLFSLPLSKQSSSLQPGTPSTKDISQTSVTKEDVQQYLGASSIKGITQEAQLLAEEKGQASAVLTAVKKGAEGVIPPYEHRSLRNDARKVELNIPWRQEAEAFVTEHFKSTHCWYPIFEETSFREDMEKMYANPQSIINDNSWVVCFNMVILFGLYSKIINMTAEERKSLEFTARMRTVTSFYNAWSALDDLEVFMTPKLRNVQALLTMAICGIEISRPTLCWTLLSQAARSAQALGLHRRDTVSHGLTKKQIQERRNLFWVIYILDKCMSLTSGRSASLPEYDCDVELPEHDGTNPYYHNFIAMISLSRIQAKIYVRLYSAQASTQSPQELETAIKELDADLKQWWGEWGYLSNVLKSQEETGALDLFEHLQLRFSHYNSETLIHRIARPGMNIYKESESKCLESARAAINMVLRVVRKNPDLASSGLLIWLFCCYPFTSFFILFSSIIRNPSAPGSTQIDLVLMQGLVAYLQNMSEKNEGAARLLSVAVAFTNVAVTFLRNYGEVLRNGNKKRSLEEIEEIEDSEPDSPQLPTHPTPQQQMQNPFHAPTVSVGLADYESAPPSSTHMPQQQSFSHQHQHQLHQLHQQQEQPLPPHLQYPNSNHMDDTLPSANPFGADYSPPIVDFQTASFLRWPDGDVNNFPLSDNIDVVGGHGGQDSGGGAVGEVDVDMSGVSGQQQIDLETLMAEPLGFQQRMEQAAMRGPLAFDWFGWDASFTP